MEQSVALKRTPLYATHVSMGARMVDFGGWEMPVQYTGLVDEHHTVRKAVALFDVSHMGEIEVRGPEALKLVDYVTTNAADPPRHVLNTVEQSRQPANRIQYLVTRNRNTLRNPPVNRKPSTGGRPNM